MYNVYRTSRPVARELCDLAMYSTNDVGEADSLLTVDCLVSCHSRGYFTPTVKLKSEDGSSQRRKNYADSNIAQLKIWALVIKKRTVTGTSFPRA